MIKQTLPPDYCCNLKDYEIPKFLPKDSLLRKKQLAQLKKLRDSISITKPENQIWFVKDTLYNPADFVLNHDYYNDSRIEIDPEFIDLEKSLFTDLYSKQPVKLAGLIIGNQILKPYDSAKKSTQTRKHYLLFSRVVFNINHSKACYYFSQGYTSPHNNWLEEEMLFAEKKQGKWHLIYRKLYSIT